VRQVAAPHRLHQEAAALPRRVRQGPRPAGVHRQRLLDQDVLPGTQREQAELEVRALRRGDVDDVHVAVLHEPFVGVVRPVDVVPLGKEVGPLPGPRGDRDRALRRVREHRLHEGGRDASRAEHSPPQRRLAGARQEHLGLGKCSGQHRLDPLGVDGGLATLVVISVSSSGPPRPRHPHRCVGIARKTPGLPARRRLALHAPGPRIPSTNFRR
jgi:hypothetical protein